VSEASRPLTVIELREEEPRAFAPTPGNERLLRTLQQAVGAHVSWSGPGGGEHVVRPRGRIGWVPVGDRTAVRIAPKVPVVQIFRMLEVAFDLPSLRFDDGSATTPEVEGVYERLALLLAEKVNGRVRRGLAKGYVAFLDELGAVRGTIDLPRTLPALARGGARLVCDFEEHSCDVEDNRLLLWALHRALAGPLRPAVKERVSRAHRALLNSVQLKAYPANAFDGRSYDRLNADYEPMHRICRLIVESSGPDLGEGEARFVPFRLDFPALFETFVARALGRELNPRWCVRPHVKRPVGRPAAFDADIDIVVLERGTRKPVLVIDTKHKAELASADVYQVSFYAHQIGAGRALLLYSREPAPRLRACNGGVEVEARGLDLERDPLQSVVSLARALEGELADATNGRELRQA
jgi:5-methylcytosine-specific restriction enzyme subunit McrC